MDKSRFGERQGQHLDQQFQNGQSDAEKLMSDHLRSPDEALPDETLNAIRIPGEDMPATPAPAADQKSKREGDDDTDDDSIGPERIITPLDVLGS